MSVRKRTWKGPAGESKESWVVDYVDASGERHIKTFARKRDADAWNVNTSIEVRSGTHTPESRSLTVGEAGELWLQTAKRAGLERSTFEYYQGHLNLHIAPLLGSTKLSQLTVPMVRAFEDRLRIDRSPAMVRKAIGSLAAILADAQERGLVAQNVARALRSRRRPGKDRRADKRQKGRLKVGVHIPSPDEIRNLIPHLTGRWRALFLTAIFTGLRASELRGLRWVDVDLKRGEIHVRQRADRFNKIGQPKSEAGERTVPLPPLLITTLRTWKLACPKGELGLAFPTGTGGPESLSNIVQRGLQPAMIAAGLIKNGKARYSGLHALRHFYASWCINRRVDGGLELPMKNVQERLGHSSIQITSDRYGHLFPRKDDGTEMAAAERTFLS